METPEQPVGIGGQTQESVARAAPPTVPGVIGAPPRKQGAWRIALGVVVIVSSLITVLAALMRASTVVGYSSVLSASAVAAQGGGGTNSGIKDPNVEQAVADATAQADVYLRALWIMLGLNGVVALGLLICGIYLLCKSRPGARALCVLSVAKCVTAVGIGVAAGGAQFCFLKGVVITAAARQPPGTAGVPPGATSGLAWFVVLTEVGIGLIAVAIPLATIVVLCRTKIRQEVAAW